jgi:tetratricopeptide (TPR) repeat protein
MSKAISTMKKIIFIVLSSSCFTAHADYNLQDYKNCSFLALDQAKSSLSVDKVPEDYLYKTQKYSFASLPITKNDENYCLIINDKKKVIVDAMPKMFSNICGGKWDKNENKPVWIDDIAGGRGLVTYFQYDISDIFKNIDKKNSSEIAQQIATIDCQHSSYTIDDVVELNDTAFYLYRLGYDKASLNLLKKVIQLDPNRIVAYLNLADVYLALKNQSQARAHYLIYANKMKKSGLSHQIPKRVLKFL